MPAAGERWGGSGSAACACTASTDEIEGVSAAAGHDKNGNLLGFATTDEIGSVMDMTKRRKTKTNCTNVNVNVNVNAHLNGGGDGGRAAPSL